MKKKDNSNNILFIVIAIIIVFCFYALAKSAAERDKKTILKNRLLREKESLERKLTRLEIEGEVVKKVYGEQLKKKELISKKARTRAVITMFSLLLIVISLLTYLSYLLSMGEPWVVTLTMLSLVLSLLLPFIKIVSAILKVEVFSIAGLNDYFEERQLKKLNAKYHFNPQNVEELLNRTTSIEAKKVLLRTEIEKMEFSLKEIEAEEEK